MATHTPNDEVLSALLDAEPVGSDAAHVAGCTQCQDRLSQLRAVAVAVGTPPPHARADVRAAAVDRAVEAASDDADSGLGGVVTPLRRRRNASKTTARRVAPLPAAAALVALIVAAGWMFTLLSGGEQTVSAPGPDRLQPGAGALRTEDGADAATGEVGLGAGRTASGDATQIEAPAAIEGAGTAVADGGDLGTVDDLSAITRRAEADLAGERNVGGLRPCRSQAAGAGTIEWQAAVTYEGRAATAYLVRGASGTRITQVWATADCSSLGRRTA
ncbi:MAG TPA: hypothetical protein VNB24_05695 [Acidimicrobiales bacterium]|nr:hypothetical protein [Acidimicrobiales bacterium]